jgi:hypothetical protein
MFHSASLPTSPAQALGPARGGGYRRSAAGRSVRLSWSPGDRPRQLDADGFANLAIQACSRLGVKMVRIFFDLIWDRICLKGFRSVCIWVRIFNIQYCICIRIQILKSHIYDVDIQSYPIQHGWHYPYSNPNPDINMKTNVISVISVRIRSVFIHAPVMQLGLQPSTCPTCCGLSQRAAASAGKKILCILYPPLRDAYMVWMPDICRTSTIQRERRSGPLLKIGSALVKLVHAEFFLWKLYPHLRHAYMHGRLTRVGLYGACGHAAWTAESP